MQNNQEELKKAANLLVSLFDLFQDPEIINCSVREFYIILNQLAPVESPVLSECNEFDMDRGLGKNGEYYLERIAQYASAKSGTTINRNEVFAIKDRALSKLYHLLIEHAKHKKEILMRRVNDGTEYEKYLIHSIEEAKDPDIKKVLQEDLRMYEQWLDEDMKKYSETFGSLI